MRTLSLMMLLTIVVLSAACSEKKPETAKPEPVVQLQAADSTGIRPANFVWGVEKHRMVNFYFQPNDSLRATAPSLLKKSLEIYEFDCQALQWLTPEPVEFYCYEDVRSLNMHTSRNEPFFIGNKIYYGYGPPFGRVFAEFVVSRLPGGESEFAFIREGIPMLLDYSGRNYHQATYNFIADGSLDPVSTLTNNEEYLKLREAMRVIEASSLVAYMMWEWGSEKFMQVYHSDKDFDAALKEVMGIDTAQLEKQWLAFLPEHTDEKEAEREAAARQGGGS